MASGGLQAPGSLPGFATLEAHRGGSREARSNLREPKAAAGLCAGLALGLVFLLELSKKGRVFYLALASHVPIY